MKRLLIIGLLVSSSALARGGSFSVEVEPIFGFERTQKVLPEPHFKNRFFYGVRVSVGVPLLSLEGEVTRASDEDGNQTISIRETTDRLKVGARATFGLGSLLSLWVRAGGQAKRSERFITTMGTTTREVEKITIRPYAGAGLKGGIGRNFSISAGLTVIFNDWPDMAQNEYQATLGFSTRFP